MHFHLYAVLFLLNCFMVFSVAAQVNKGRTYTINDGLPSNKVYKIVQDNQGYIWLATEEGASRFDGYDFQTFSMNDGLPGNDVLAVRKDQMGNVWFTTYNGRLALYRAGKIETIQLPGPHLPDDILLGVMDTDSSLWITSKTRSCIFYVKNGETQRIDSLYGEPLVAPIVHSEKGVGLISDRQQLLKPFGDSLKRIIRFPIGFTKPSEYGVLIKAIPSRQNRFYLITRKGLFFYNGESRQVERIWPPDNTFSEDTRWFIGQLSDELFFGLQHHKVYLFNAEGEIQEQYSTESLAVNVYLDDERNIWIGTLASGVKFISYNERQVQRLIPEEIAESSEVMVVEHLEDNNLLAAFSDNTIIRITSDGQLTFGQLDVQPLKKNRPYSIIAYTRDIKQHRGVIYFANDVGLLQVDHGELDKLTDKLPSQSIKVETSPCHDYAQGALKHILPIGNTLFIATSKGLFECNTVGPDSSSIEKHYGQRTTAVAPWPGNGFIAGTNSGALFFNSRWSVDTLLLSGKSITTIAIDKKGNAWLGTSSHGLFVINQKFEIRHVLPARELKKGRVNKIFITDSIIWAGTSKGIFRLNYSYNGTMLKTGQIATINSLDGLAADNVNDLIKRGDTLYIATDNGINLIDVSEVEWNHPPPKVFIDEVEINGKDKTLQDNYLIDFGHSLSIGFNAISFFSQGKITYQYRLHGHTDKWTTTQQRYVKFPVLPAGSYRFEIRASNSHGTWSAPLGFLIKVHPPFWQQPYFYFLCSLAVIAVISGIAYWRVRKIKQRQIAISNINKRIAEYKLKALHAQMNPHFVFNALHSIQSYMMKNDPKQAGFYLMKFAQLMRLVLEASIKKEITLKEELDTLQLYLELETLRFDGRVEYFFSHHLEKPLHEVTIPSMLIQPFVENAILHGAAASRGKSKINVMFEMKNNYINCYVENTYSRNVRDKDTTGTRRTMYPSRSMQIIKERMNTLKDLNGSELSFETETLQKKDGIISFRVIIRIKQN